MWLYLQKCRYIVEAPLIVQYMEISKGFSLHIVKKGKEPIKRPGADIYGCDFFISDQFHILYQ
jgi:hypothetical protein